MTKHLLDLHRVDELKVSKVLGIPLLVTACCDNSGVSRMVT